MDYEKKSKRMTSLGKITTNLYIICTSFNYKFTVKLSSEKAGAYINAVLSVSKADYYSKPKFNELFSKEASKMGQQYRQCER